MTVQPQPAPVGSERTIFLGALKLGAAGERAAYLAAACSADPALRRRVEELLREQDQVGAFLEQPALAGKTEIIACLTEKPGDRIGRYKLLQQIGEGGTGVVYMAEQEEPVRRRVALKVIKLGMDTRSIIARFEAERQALALMDHPNIAKVLDAGATETGRPFFVMELVRGIKITDYCDQHNLPPRERLLLFIQVCQAIQHAHQKGIIHRDVKPSNILVTLHDGVPVPKVIDFGIAKATEHRLTDKTLFTQFSTFIGTPAYMSPEQAEMSGLDVDTRSDIYALGVLLYELLTGKTPFDAETLHQATLDECRRMIRETEPERPSTRLATLIEADLTTTAHQRHTEAPRLIHLLRGDLDWIVMKCLEKDRTRRYATTNALATDLQCYLDGQPVLARPPSNVYRFRKFVRRHQGAFGAAAIIVLTLVAGAALSTWQAIRATQAERHAQVSRQQEIQLRRQAEADRTRAEREEASARLNEYVADINLAQQSLTAGNYGRAVQLLDKHRPMPGDDAPDLRGFEWRYLWQTSQGDEHTAFPTLENAVQSVAISPNGRLLIAGLRDQFYVFNTRNRAALTNLAKGAISMAFAPDGKSLITASPTTVRAWQVADWTERHALPRNTGPVALSKDGARLATLLSSRFPNPDRDLVRVWNTRDWRQTLGLTKAMGPMAFAPDGCTLATDSRAGITLWPLTNARPEVVLEDSTNLFARGGPWFQSDRVMAFSPDGRFVVAARNTLSERGVFVVSIWDAQSGREVATMPDDPEHVEHTGTISSLAFSPDGRQLATASMDYSIRLWDFARRQLVATFQGHASEVWTVAFSPDGQSLVSGAKDGSVKLWPLRRGPTEDLLPGDWQPLAFSPDSRLLAAVNREGAVSFLNLSTREPEQEFAVERSPDRGRFRPPPPPLVAVSADLTTVAQAGEDGSVQLWNTLTHDSTTLKVADRPLSQLALSPDGLSLITGGWGRSLRWWDLRHGTNLVMESDAFRVMFAPDNRTLAAISRGNTVELWDVPTRSLRTHFVSVAQLGFSAAFAPDGRTLAIAGFDDVVRLWDTATGTLAGQCVGHKQTVFSLAFAPDGKTLATTSDDSTLKLWNVGTQQELLTIRRLGGALRTLLFSPDGRLLVCGSSFRASAGGLRFYHAPRFRETDGTAVATNP